MVDSLCKMAPPNANRAGSCRSSCGDLSTNIVQSVSEAGTQTIPTNGDDPSPSIGHSAPATDVNQTIPTGGGDATADDTVLNISPNS